MIIIPFSDFVHVDNDDDVRHQADEMRRLDEQVKMRHHCFMRTLNYVFVVLVKE